MNAPKIPDDPVIPDLHFDRGFLAFAGINENDRGTQVFFANSASGNSLHFGPLDGGGPGETPVGFISPQTLEHLAKIYAGYGDMAPHNPDGVDCGRLWVEGPSYAHENFPKLTFINECKVVVVDGRKVGNKIVRKTNQPEKIVKHIPITVS